MEPSIIRQGEQEGEGYLGTAHALPSGPRGQTGPQRGEIWRDAPGICDLTSAPCESLSEGRRRFSRGTATSSLVRVSGFLSKRSDSRGTESGRAARCSLEVVGFESRRIKCHSTRKVSLPLPRRSRGTSPSCRQPLPSTTHWTSWYRS